MQAPGDNSITVVDPHVQTYADNNLNEKNLGTQYIYTTEGQLIPTTSEQISTNMDLNSQHYNTVHVTEAQGMHIRQVDYQYQQQYPDGTVQQVIPISDTAFVQDQNTTYMIDQTAFIASSTQEVVQTTEGQVYPSQIVTEANTEATTYVFDTSQEQESYVTEQQPVLTTTGFISEYESTTNDQQNTQQIIEPAVEPSLDSGETVTEKVATVSENFDEATENIKSAETNSEENVAEQVLQESSIENTTENDELQQNIEDVKEADQEIEKNSHHEIVAKELKIDNPAQQEEVNSSVGENQQGLDEPLVNKEQLSEEVNNEVIQQEVATKQEENQEASAQVQEETSIAEAEQEEGTAPAVEDNAVEVRSETVSSSTVSTEPSQTPRPRGRRPKTEIPLHILGHDVSKPMDNVVNGKTPKPRLGVKVPYRNLTSQIVSKEELEKEIVERGRKKQEEKKEVLFARQLTSRLAKRIAPEPSGKSTTPQPKSNNRKDKQEVEVIIVQESQQMEVDSNDNEENNLEKKDAIDNNSDLLAILEGDGDTEEIPVLSKDESQAKESTPTDETNIKNLEREIALQQLQDLPYLSPSTRFVKGKQVKELPPKLSEGKPTKAISGKSASNISKPNAAKEKTPLKSSPIKLSPDKKPGNLDKKALEVEPQIKVNMALKTYSRKRKSTDSITESVASPTKKTTVVVNTAEIDLKPSPPVSASGDVYVTKSSRVIKKKVIWDPDESIPSRLTPVKPATVKTESPVHPKASPKPVQPKNDNRTADLPKKSAVEPKIKNEKKVDEKPSPKKTAHSPAEKRTSPGSKVAMKAKKPKTEIDRLLGDEGAIKMLYDLKNSEDHIEEKRKKTVFSVEKTFKDLAKKANQIKSDLVNTSTVESPKSLRKKEPVVSPAAVITPKSTPPPSVSAPVVPSAISRQKSKDSSRSTPPPSPSFPYPNETSYLIRRRSSSSISSGGDTGGSVEFDDIEDRTPRKKTASDPLTDPLKIKKSKKNSESRELERSQKRAENRIGHYKTFSFKKFNKSITIDLYNEKNTGCYLTSELLDELTTALNKIAKEKDCNVVLIRSSHTSIFSRGLDYKELLSDKESIRKTKASELADRVCNFIQCLLGFPKILVAAVQGECIGLAVTMLPLFDLVISSDNATFSTPYITLGSIAEAGFLLTVPHVASHGLAGELLYASQKLTADEAFRRGLISKLCWPEKYQDAVKTTVTSIAKGSKQSLESTKEQIRANIRERTQEAIEAMSSKLIDHWTSNECQSNFAKIVE